MRSSSFFLCIAVLCALAQAAHAQTVQERLVSSTFKTLAKAYIATTDFKKLKKSTLLRLEQLDTDSFHARYPRTLQLVKDSPALGKKFGLSPDMSVEQARAFILSLDKKKVSAVIDAVPDTVVARHVMEDFSRAGKSAKSNNIADQATAVWGIFQERLDRTAKRSAQ